VVTRTNDARNAKRSIRAMRSADMRTKATCARLAVIVRFVAEPWRFRARLVRPRAPGATCWYARQVYGYSGFVLMVLTPVYDRGSWGCVIGAAVLSAAGHRSLGNAEETISSDLTLKRFVDGEVGCATFERQCLPPVH